MTRRRLLTIALAVLLTIFGMIIIVAYVNAADRRAQQGTDLVSVLVASDEIPAQTPATDLADRTVIAEWPERLVQPDAVTEQADLAELEGQVTSGPIRAGEQVVGRQFAPADQVTTGGAADVERGKEIVTIALEPQRAVGGQLAAGDAVSVIVSSGAGRTQSDGGESVDAKNPTQVVLSNIEVTAVSGGVTEEGEQASGSVLVSLEVDELDAERIVFGMEHASIWLTRNGEDVPPANGQARTADNIFDVDPGGAR